MKTVIAVALLLSIASYGRGAKILGVFTSYGRSHYILGSALMRALADRGHEVTVVSCYGEKDLPKNISYRDIVLDGQLEKIKDFQKEQNFNMFDRADSNPFMMLIFMTAVIPKLMGSTLQHKQMQNLIHSGEKFDVVIVEQFLNDAENALATHFNAPLILFNSVGASYWVNSITGNPSPLSYIPEILLDYSVPMSFTQRLSNTAMRLLTEFLFNVLLRPAQNEEIQKFIPNGPHISEVLYNSSIVLMNSHPSLNQPVPYVPNLIDIGGYHVKPPKKLPKDLQEYLDNAKEGVIYFSMGSNLKSAEFPPEKREAILKTLAKLKVKVLWKWEDDVLPGQPSNVKLGKWLPQQDILAHPNVKLFITHGGFLSTTETVYHGVPILAIPVYGDQKSNAKIAVEHGFALTLPYAEISEHKLTERIEELLSNPKYRENAKKISELFHDRQVSPKDTAVYWVEYVIRHRGAPHLRVAGLDLPWYKYHLLDVIAFFAVAALCSIFVSIYCMKLISRKFCSKKKTKKVKKN